MRHRHLKDLYSNYWSHEDKEEYLEDFIINLKDEVMELEELCGERLTEIESLRRKNNELTNELSYQKIRTSLQRIGFKKKLDEKCDVSKEDEIIFENINKITQSHLNKLLASTGIQL